MSYTTEDIANTKSTESQSQLARCCECLGLLHDKETVVAVLYGEYGEPPIEKVKGKAKTRFYHEDCFWDMKHENIITHIAEALG